MMSAAIIGPRHWLHVAGAASCCDTAFERKYPEVAAKLPCRTVLLGSVQEIRQVYQKAGSFHLLLFFNMAVGGSPE